MTGQETSAERPTRNRRGRPSSTGLNQQVILDAALAIVEQDGPHSLTLRRLGTDLGVNHTAVLRHFSDKDEILRGLAEQLVNRALEGFEPAANWRATLTAMARRIRAACVAHPGVAVLVATRVSRREGEFRGAEAVVAALREAGFEDRDAARYYRALADTALAAGAYEAAFANLDPASLKGDREAWRREYLLASPAAYPNLAAVAPFLADIDEEEIFETTLGLILDAVELRSRRNG
ncbi:TetR/AcrR family transcriptional regulator C-terminal domain-containing protein [Streptomyces sp. NPDC014861]|uniref:TetR/AcrR family transcriptional regulator C-terminal domain-containing protein n=1 Tax=Streptomyces sp. NPDC014861 TaxID=3364923 RepID=UPI0036F57A18